MPKAKDLTELRFGKLIAVRPTEERKNGSIVWECHCDCGKVVFLAAAVLQKGHAKSCGCLVEADIAGQRFGKLIAVRPTEERRYGYVIWECRCDCGNTTFSITSNLRSGNTRSCGCLQKAEAAKRQALDLAGMRFGRLTAVGPTEKRVGNGSVVWECRCDCGNITYVSSHNLRSGRTQSCRCFKSTKA